VQNFGNCDNADKHVVLGRPGGGRFRVSNMRRQLEKIDSGTGGRGVKPLVPIVVVLLVAAAGYLAYRKFSGSAVTGGVA